MRASARSARGAVALSVRTNEAGRLTVVVQRKLVGHRKGKRCVAGRRRGAKACTLWVRAKTVTRTVKAGALTVRLPRGALRRGSYRALVTVRDGAGNVSVKRTVGFNVR